VESSYQKLPPPPSPRYLTREALRARTTRFGHEAQWLERLRDVDVCTDDVLGESAHGAACVSSTVEKAVILCVYGHAAAFEFA
jgi:hypothetical protein